MVHFIFSLFSCLLSLITAGGNKGFKEQNHHNQNQNAGYNGASGPAGSEAVSPNPQTIYYGFKPVATPYGNISVNDLSGHFGFKRHGQTDLPEAGNEINDNSNRINYKRETYSNSRPTFVSQDNAVSQRYASSMKYNSESNNNKWYYSRTPLNRKIIRMRTKREVKLNGKISDKYKEFDGPNLSSVEETNEDLLQVTNQKKNPLIIKSTIPERNVTKAEPSLISQSSTLLDATGGFVEATVSSAINFANNFSNMRKSIFSNFQASVTKLANATLSVVNGQFLDKNINSFQNISSSNKLGVRSSQEDKLNSAKSIVNDSSSSINERKSDYSSKFLHYFVSETLTDSSSSVNKLTSHSGNTTDDVILKMTDLNLRNITNRKEREGLVKKASSLVKNILKNFSSHLNARLQA